MITIAVTFLSFLALFTVIGLLSSRHKSSTTEDYLVAGRDVNPWLTALSQVATLSSGFMFIGLVAFAYKIGLASVWMMVGWIVGDFFAWLWVFKRVRTLTEKANAHSVPSFIAAGKSRAVVVVAGVLTFFLLGGYAAAQLKAGSITLHQMFGWHEAVGSILGAGIVLAYCYSGGLRASIWTDAAQAIVMLVAIVVLLAMSAIEAGAPAAMLNSLETIDPTLTNWFPTDPAFGFGLYLLGMIAGGLGVLGQPQVLIRSMSIESPAAIDRARIYYFTFYIPFFIACIGVGLYGRVLMPEIMAPGGISPEATMPRLAMEILPNALIGLMLAGLFGLTMSTADSQLLSCSAAVTQDVFPQWSESYAGSKIATVSVTLVALLIALFVQESVFSLVLSAYALLGATIGPLLILRVLERTPSGAVGMLMMASGLITVVLWDRWLGFADDVYKLLPGFVAAFVAYAIGSGIEAAVGSGAVHQER